MQVGGAGERRDDHERPAAILLEGAAVLDEGDGAAVAEQGDAAERVAAPARRRPASSGLRASPSARSHCSTTKADGAPGRDELAVARRGSRRRRRRDRHRRRSASASPRATTPTAAGSSAASATATPAAVTTIRASAISPSAPAPKAGTTSVEPSKPLTQCDTRRTFATATPMSSQIGRSSPNGKASTPTTAAGMTTSETSGSASALPMSPNGLRVWK